MGRRMIFVRCTFSYSSLLVSHVEYRPFPQELLGCQSRQEHVRLLFEQKATRSLQPLLLGEQKLAGAGLGEQTSCLPSLLHF